MYIKNNICFNVKYYTEHETDDGHNIRMELMWRLDDREDIFIVLKPFSQNI